jgi:hypothetical protein
MVVGPRRWWLLLADDISPSSLVLSLLVVASHHWWYLPISWHSWSHHCHCCCQHSPGVVVVSPLASPVPAGCFPTISRNPRGLGWADVRLVSAGGPPIVAFPSHLCRNNVKLVKENNKRTREKAYIRAQGAIPPCCPPLGIRTGNPLVHLSVPIPIPMVDPHPQPVGCRATGQVGTGQPPSPVLMVTSLHHHCRQGWGVPPCK